MNGDLPRTPTTLPKGQKYFGVWIPKQDELISSGKLVYIYEYNTVWVLIEMYIIVLLYRQVMRDEGHQGASQVAETESKCSFPDGGVGGGGIAFG
jgi:hypothetical protein